MSDWTEALRAAARSEAPAVGVVSVLLGRAREVGASDVHVDPSPSGWTVRARLDGVLHEVARVPREEVPTLVARLKVLAELPTYVVDRAQDGRIPGEGGASDLRLAILPTIHGEKAVVRVFDDRASAQSLEELGLPGESRVALERAILSPQGLVVVAGPAGSGKSTTIHAALRRIRERSGGARHVVGIEDPVERPLEGVTQAQVSAASGFGFPEALRAFLRQDPDVIYVGEVRDVATASVAVDAGLTGHLVLTSLHAGDAAQVATRLLDMGIEAHRVTSSLSAVFAQRLLRRRCPEHVATDCAVCQGTGYSGRLPIVEHLVGEQVRAAVRGEVVGGGGLRAHARLRVEVGETTEEEVERVLGPLS